MWMCGQFINVDVGSVYPRECGVRLHIWMWGGGGCSLSVLMWGQFINVDVKGGGGQFIHVDVGAVHQR